MAFVRSVGTALRRAGQSLEKLGLGMQGSLGFKETCEHISRHVRKQTGSFRLTSSAMQLVLRWPVLAVLVVAPLRSSIDAMCAAMFLHATAASAF